MPYDRLRARLAERPTPTVSTLPDGSVDRYCTLTAGAVGPLRTRAALAREIEDPNRSSFRLRVESVEPGGQAVNVARQLHALGADVTCYGHLDDPVFDDLPFEGVSMGEPALVNAFNFADSDVMFAEGASLDGWTLDDLRAVADLEAVFGADAVCVSNWVSVPSMGAAFDELGGTDLPRVPVLVDPGDVVGSTPADIDRLRSALANLQASFDVVYNANRQEIRATAATLPDPPADDAGRLRALRDAMGLEAVVLHGVDEAVAATVEGVVAVDSLPVEDPVRFTGGGDRFTGGLAHALASGWGWPAALACGNACASRYVATGGTGTAADVAASLEARADPGS